MSGSRWREHFDQWAKTYNDSVRRDGCPFAGSERLLGRMVERAGVQDGDRVFDLGIGTGNSALRLTGPGIELWGMDLSRRMLDVAASRLPDAHLVCAGVFRLVPATTG